MAHVTVRVHPRARRSGIAGRVGDAWKLDLAAPPVEGKANEACVRFFAELVNVPRSRVRIVSGAASRTKVVAVEGLEQPELERALQAQPLHRQQRQLRHVSNQQDSEKQN